MGSVPKLIKKNKMTYTTKQIFTVLRRVIHPEQAKRYYHIRHGTRTW
jgi:Mor family transcriptional regulator